MCCCCFPRCSIIYAGIFCLVESIVWVILASFGIALYTCDYVVEPDITDPTYYLYFIYFLNRDCAELPDELKFDKILDGMFPSVTTPNGFTIPPDITTPFPIPDWPDRFAQVDSTYNVMELYLGFNAAWAVTCFIAVVAAVMSVRTWFIYVPWILMTAANIILDVTETIPFANDAMASQTPQGLLETLIGVDLSQVSDYYTDQIFNQPTIKDMEGVTMIPSIVMALLTIRFGVFWLLNVLHLICVSVAVFGLSKEKGKEKNPPTYPTNEPNIQESHNNWHVEEPHINKPRPGHDYTDAPNNSRPFSYIELDLKRPSSPPPQPLTNRGSASSVAVPGTNLYSPAREPLYLELNQPPQRFHKPLAAGDNNERQEMNRKPVHSDVNEVIRVPHITRTDSNRSFQPSLNNRPPSNIAIPRADLRSPAPEPNAEYLEPRQGHHNSLASADNYELPPVTVERGTNGPDVPRKPPNLHRTESDRPPYRPSASTSNLQRQSSTTKEEVDGPQDHNSKVGHRLSSLLTRPSVNLPPDELRSQLPWSYFGPRNAPLKPKPKPEPMAEQDEELEMPPVPVPDYTLHFGKTNRPAPCNWSDDRSSSGESEADHRGTSASGVDKTGLESKRY